MSSHAAGPLHAYLSGTGRDGRGRRAEDVIAFSDDELESIHDYIQWLFPLPTRSAAQPQAPVLSGTEVEAIRRDSAAIATLERAAERMLRFYRDTDRWLVPHDHNHLRITRIIQSLGLLARPRAAHLFHDAVLELNARAGRPVNARSLRFWEAASGRSRRGFGQKKPGG